MEALTIDYLNSIDTLKNQKDLEYENIQKSVEDCLNGVASILALEWHNVSNEWTRCNGVSNWSSNGFEIVKDMYEKNGIEISYYRPHNIFSFRLI